MTNQPPRWVYRFENYQRAFGLLREAIETTRQRPLSQLEKEGLIQRFEYNWELAWKVLKDYLEESGIVLETITPGSVIKTAFAAKVIDDGDAWMRALDARNKMSHTYNIETFERIISDINQEYFRLFESLFQKMQELKENKGKSHA